MSNAHATRISHRLRELNHPVNSMDPSPFIVATSITKPEFIVTSAPMWVRLVAVHPQSHAAVVAATPKSSRWRHDSSMPNSTSPHSLDVPVQTTFRHMETSPAIATLIDDEARNLARFFDGITHCHVVIASPHKHQRHGRRFSVHIDLGVPHGPIVVAHEPAERGRLRESARNTKAADANYSQEDLYAVVREAFATARRRLDEHARRLRNHKESFLP